MAANSAPANLTSAATSTTQALPTSTTTAAAATTTTTTTGGQHPSSSQAALVGTTCMELALEGERLCKNGDLKNGVRFFEEAIKVGTNDDRTLSSIYSQLGNAYFYMEDYEKALDYHKLDVNLVSSSGDQVAEAKACGNLGSTYKMLSKFDEAACYCRRQLEISRKLNDNAGEGRALYNLANVYHTQGKRLISACEQEPGELSNYIKSSLLRAVEYYEMALKVVTKLNDFTSMGRAYGNLGNVHYVLGNFELAVESHKKRLELAKQTNDKSAERRAQLNLGNANVFLGNFPEAIENYSATLKLAQELQDKYTEATSCYSLANTYTFLRDYKSAVTYHLKYLNMLKEIDDKLGEGRACWSLVNIYQMVNDPESALNYAKKHYEIAELLGDKAGLASAKLNIAELEEIISQKQAAQIASSHQNDDSVQESGMHTITNTNQTTGKMLTSVAPDKLQEQEQRRFKKQLNSNLAGDIDGLTARRRGGRGSERGVVRSSSSERLFDMIAHFQSGRIDDQRCEIYMKQSIRSDSVRGSGATTLTTTKTVDDKENLASRNAAESTSTNGSVGESLGKGSQHSITNPMNAVSAAASAIKATYRKASLVAYPTSMPSIQSQRRPTVSAEHREQLFDLIAGAQGQRMDEQRASLPALTLANGTLKNPMSAGLLSRGHTLDQSASAKIRQQQFDQMPETIIEVQPRGKSHSMVPQSNATPTPTPTPTITRTSNDILNASKANKPRPHKLTRHFQTVDSDAQVQDENFLDKIMKYQSTRFNDQRSEFPNKTTRNSAQTDADKGQADNFFNLIVRFQSDRIDDQRSAPPARNKNI